MTARCLRIWSARALWWARDRSKSCRATRSTIWRGGAKNSTWFSSIPFRQNALPAVLERLPARLAALARVYVEAAAPLEPQAAWRELKRSRAGQVSYQLLEWRGDDQGRLPGNV